jgi:hypothetical protein
MTIESPLLPSPLSSLKPGVIPNSSTHKIKLINRNPIYGRMRDLQDPNKLSKVLFSVRCDERLGVVGGRNGLFQHLHSPRGKAKKRGIFSKMP